MRSKYRCFMPKCPYCSEELRLKLSAQNISEIDSDFYDTMESYIESSPRMLRGILKSQMVRIAEYPPLVQLIACAYCDTLLSAKIQDRSIRG